MVKRLYLRFENLLDKLTEINPFHQLGAIGVFFIWVILASGAYLFIFYEISASRAHASAEAIRRECIG
jgi:hypothetical protein